MTSMRDLLLIAFDKHSVSPALRAGIAAICGGESELKPVRETSYSHTSNERIRGIFSSRLGSLSDAALNELKKDDHAFFERVYGGRYGNDQPGDGYKYRGGGVDQHTFKDNYRIDGEAIGVDLVGSPERILDPETAVEAAVVYMLRCYHPVASDSPSEAFARMKKAVGNSIGTPDARKNELWAKYSKSGEWNAPAPAHQAAQEAGEAQPVAEDAGQVAPVAPAPPPPPASRPAVRMEPVEAIRAIQRVMQAAGVYVENKDGKALKVDGDFRGESIAALDELLRLAGQPGLSQ